MLNNAPHEPASSQDRHQHAGNDSTSLLFQFILIQFIEAQTEMQRLEHLCHRKEAPLTSKSILSYQTPAALQQIAEILNKLTGSMRDYMKLFSWSFGDGILAKLKANCQLLLEKCPEHEKELFALQHYADKMILWSLQAKQLVKAPEEKNTDDQMTLFIVSIDKASSAMQRFAKQLARVALEFKEDENVLLCLLRYKESLDKLFGNRFVPKLLLKMYPKGLKEVEHFIITKYVKRGFDEVPAVVALKIAEIEASIS